MFADWFEPFLYWTGCSETNSRDPLVTPCDLKGELFWDAWIPFSDAFELMGARSSGTAGVLACIRRH